MLAQAAVQLGLAVLVEPQRDVQFGQRLAGQDALEEHDQIPRAGALDVKVGAGKAEHDAQLGLLHQHGVDDDAAFFVP